MFTQSYTQTFCDLVNIQASLQPNIPAVISSSAMLTYAELVDRSNRLAHGLIAAGVLPESIVGICLERSVDMIVAVLAVLKAGGAYVPLDPAYPGDRLAFMVEDSAADIILAQTSTQSSLPLTQTPRILLDTFDFSAYPAEAQQIAVAPEHLAYVIYTSGSTGRPKGVMVEHRSLTAFAHWTKERFTPAQTNRVLGASSLSFDVSIFEITAPLSSGGAIVLVRNVLDLLLEPPTEPVSLMLSVPSPIAELARARAIPSSLRTMLVGGEILSHTLTNEIYRTTNVQEVINMWGVTEDTVVTTEYLVPKVMSTDPPIGAAFSGRRIHLLDTNLQPVSPGTPGEICCTGTGVARGYLNRPEITSERFVSNPFGDSERMYRSGDLAVENPDGEIHFIGRNDQQIKIHGYRVELGEIEAVLANHPSIAQVAVIAKSLGGSMSLAMFAVSHTKTILSLTDVQEFLLGRLPKHMIPATLTMLDAMPLGPTGKTDRKALKSLVAERPTLIQAYVEPRNEVERAIADLAASLLGIERVGIYDNFFALGGQSLLAARFNAEITSVFEHEVAAFEKMHGERALIRAFWQQPTVAQLAAAIQGLSFDKPAATNDAMRCLQPGASDRTPIFLLHGVIDGNAFYPWNIAHTLGPDQPFYTLAPHGHDNTPIPSTIEQMAVDYLAKIRVVQPHGPYRLAGYCNGGIVCFEMARMLEADGETIDLLMLINTPGDNIRFRKLEALVKQLRFVLGLDLKTQRALFAFLRGRMTWLAQFLTSIRQKHPAKTATDTSTNSRPPMLPAVKAREDALASAIDLYVPKSYGGDAIVIFGEIDASLRENTPFREWIQVIPHARTVSVPGDHHFVEDYPELLVEYFRG